MPLFRFNVKPAVDDIIMVDISKVFFLYPVKSDKSCVRYYIPVHWTWDKYLFTRNTRPCITGHPLGPSIVLE